MSSGTGLAFRAIGGKAMREERRNIRTRSALVQQVLNDVIQNPSVTLTVNTLQTWLDLPLDAAQRILQRLASSGLVQEVQRGVWARGTWPGAQREWY
jgi:ribosomal protein S25